VTKNADDKFELLLTGQKKLETQYVQLSTKVDGLSTKVDGLSTKVDHLTTDVDKLKTDVSVLKTDVSVLKTDVAELKTDVSVLKTDVAELKEGQNRTERFLLNLENLIVPKINAMYESAMRFDKHAEEAQETKRIQTEKLENHELRITRLEHEARQ
jgi:outer membrane murein-binding lipoprotein Lpp